jgi:glycosyltransferase involved in cell wall biosynthesis
MLGLVIPTLNAEAALPTLLRSIGDAPLRIVISDGGSTDRTLALALERGVIALGAKGRGAQLARGADLCGAVETVSHYLFLHADCVLPKNWSDVVQVAIAQPNIAHYFQFDPQPVKGLTRQWLRFIVHLRCWAWKLPYGDQGLLISREMYDALGGYDRDKPLFEDVDLVERIVAKYGRGALQPLPAALQTDVSAHIRDGVWKRGWRNYKLLRAYKRGVSITELSQSYLS